MAITSFVFIAFIIAALLVYRLFPSNRQWWVLLAASVVFYLSFSINGIFVMIGTSLLTYYAAVLVQKQKDGYSQWLNANKATTDKETRKAKKAFFHRRQNLIVAGDVAVTLGILFLCKYYGELATQSNILFHTRLWTAENILLPLGISYYSLQLIGYLADVNRDIIPAERNPLKVMLYGGFFLSIMQGPFNRYNDLMPQICAEERKKLTYMDFKFAVIRIVGGYIKKLCIADQFALIANEVFTNYTSYSGLGILLGIVCFAVQLYTDFSGYMDIIVGIGQLFGIEMPENFRQPFFSASVSEFWQRWHITLGAWLKDYVFYPILKSTAFKNLGKWIAARAGKEAGRKIPTYLGMLILWTLIGAWHGSGFHYVFGVGLLQFIYMLLGEVCAPLFVKAKALLRINDKKLYWRIFQSLRTTALMMFAWIFFNAKSFIAALDMIRRMFVLPDFDQVKGISLPYIMQSTSAVDSSKRTMVFFLICTLVLASIILIVSIDILHEKGKSLRHIVSDKRYPVRLAFYLLLALSFLLLGVYGNSYSTSNFLYARF